MSNAIQIKMLGKPGCHLCDDAREAIDEVMNDFKSRHPGTEISFVEQSILDDEKLATKYFEEIPVIFINDKQHAYWRVDTERLTRALFALANS